MKKYINLSELQLFAIRPTSIIFNDGSFQVGFNSCNEARDYAVKNKIVYKEIINECIIEKY